MCEVVAARQSEMFSKPKRKSPRVMMQLTDVGNGIGAPFGASYVCDKCGYQTGWCNYESRPPRKEPCPDCNLSEEEIEEDRARICKSFEFHD